MSRLLFKDMTKREQALILKKYKARNCCTIHHCVLCESHIICGEGYRDGGYNRRAHTRCIIKYI